MCISEIFVQSWYDSAIMLFWGYRVEKATTLLFHLFSV